MAEPRRGEEVRRRDSLFRRAKPLSFESARCFLRINSLSDFCKSLFPLAGMKAPPPDDAAATLALQEQRRPSDVSRTWAAGGTARRKIFCVNFLRSIGKFGTNKERNALRAGGRNSLTEEDVLV
jgi:hypothetical protein